MASIKLFAVKEDTSKDGKVPVYLQLIHMRKPKYIPLKIWVTSAAFDFSEVKCTPKHDNYLTYNAKLSQKKAIADAALIDLADRSFTPESLAAHIKLKLRNEGKPLTIGMISEEIQKINIKQGSPGNAKVYENVISTFTKWFKKDAVITDIDSKKLVDYKIHLIQTGKKPNTISNYLRTIKALFMFSGIFTSEQIKTLFPRKFIPGTPRGKKKPRDKTTIKALEKIAPTLTGFMKEVVYTTLLQFYFQGCDLIDIVLNRDFQIENNYLSFERYKNRADTDPPAVTVKIIPKAKKILDYFKSIRNEDSDFLVPICEDFDARVNLSLYETRRRNFNRSLALVCEKVGLKKEEYLSCKDMRYYWATIAANMGVSEDDRMRAQGQKIPGVAEGYVDYDQTIIDKINARVTK